MDGRRNVRNTFSIFGMVSTVMALLKLKEKWDDSRAAESRDEGRASLGNPPSYRDDDTESAHPLLDSEAPIQRPKRKRSACCMCCGVNCSLFWKAIGIVFAIFTVWNAFKLLRWSLTSAPTGLENMPKFSTSLGCENAPFTYKDGQQDFSVASGPKFDHTLDILGVVPGTITVIPGGFDSTEIKYEVLLKTNYKTLLDGVGIELPTASTDGSVTDSKVLIGTLKAPFDPKLCMRYDVTVHVPPTLKQLYINSNGASQVAFAPEAHLQLDNLQVVLSGASPLNMILPQKFVQAKNLALEVYQGWIVGDVSIDKETIITTQRGDGVANIHAYQSPPLQTSEPETAILSTNTGSGRTDIFYIGDVGIKRPIDNTHDSAGKGDVYLTYKKAAYNGKINFNSNSYTITGAQTFRGLDQTKEWTHFFGDENGADRMTVKSRGWTGLYF